MHDSYSIIEANVHKNVLETDVKYEASSNFAKQNSLKIAKLKWAPNGNFLFWVSTYIIVVPETKVRLHLLV